jgi:hypothetical protein
MSENRVIRDGKVAVIYNPNFGCGWYTDFCWIDDLLFDPKLVNIILHPNYKNNKRLSQDDETFDKELDNMINEYIEDVNNRKYIINCGILKGKIYNSNFKYKIYDLDIYWVPIGKKFFITNYDGEETVHVENEWIKT